MCARLGIRIIPASSPQAKGRIERNHGTQQDRLVKKLRRQGIGDVDTANAGHILHDWNIEEKLTLLKKAHDALPKGGALIVHEAIIDDNRSKNAFGLLMSLNMLIETPGGFDYSGADCKGWMKKAGFRKTFGQHLAGPDSMVVGIK
jgi:hypothetical protein